MANAPVKVEVTVEGAERLNKLGESFNALKSQSAGASQMMQRVKTNVSSTTQAVSAFSVTNQAAGRAIGERVKDLDAMAKGFGVLSPRVQGAVGAFGSFASVAAGLGSSLGPIGIGIAVVTTALPLLIGYLSNTGDEMEDVGRATRDATEDLDAFISKAREAAAEAGRTQRLNMGLGTVEETGGRLDQENAYRARLRERMNALIGEIDLTPGSEAENRIADAISAGDVGGTRSAMAGAAPGNARAIEEHMAEAVRLAREFERTREIALRLERDLAVAQDDRISGAEDEHAIELDDLRIQREANEASENERRANAAERERAERERERIAAWNREQIEIMAEAQHLREGASRFAAAHAGDMFFDPNAEQEAWASQNNQASANDIFRQTEEDAGRDQAEEFLSPFMDNEDILERWNEFLENSGGNVEKAVRAAKTLGYQMRAVNMTSEAFADITGLALQNIIDGNMSVKDGVMVAMDYWLEQFGIQEAMKGASALAEYIGSWGLNVAKAEEAAVHFALAAAAGIGAAAIDGTTPSEAQAKKDEQDRQEQERMQDDGGDGQGGGGDFYFVANYPMFNTKAEIGRALEEYQRTARRRF